ncbi:MAG: hypothetical protein M1269_06060 [Chloroflexi bacterium]|nr:hypothetical protein [Chloroflexota bacterium]
MMRVRGVPDAQAETQAREIENRIMKGIESGLDPEKIRVEKHYSSADIIWDKMIICTIDSQMALANKSEPEQLAEKIVWRLKTSLKGGLLTLTPSELVMPIGGRQVVQVGGFLKKGLEILSSGSQVNVTPAEDGSYLEVTAVAPGTTSITVARGPFKTQLSVTVKEWAGTINRNSEADVTGNPLPLSVAERAALNAAADACSIKPGAKIILSGDVRIFDSSLNRQEMLARVPIEIKGTGYFSLTGTVDVRLINRGLKLEQPTRLMVSNRPELLEENGILLTGPVDKENPTRLLYSHKNGSDKPRVIWVSLENPNREDAQVLITPAAAGPSPYEMAVGTRTVQRFLECLAGQAGYIVNLPAQSSTSLAERWLSKNDVDAGFFQIQELKGGELTLKVTTTEVGADDAILGMVTPRFDPFKVHPHGIFSGPDFLSEGDIQLPDGSFDFEIGGEPYLLDDESGQPNLGNYGSLYRFNINIKNHDRREQVLGVYFEPLKGVAQGCFLLNGKIYNVGVTRFGESRCWYRETIPPGAEKKLTIYTMPQPGSYYPVKVSARSEKIGGRSF